MRGMLPSHTRLLRLTCLALGSLLPAGGCTEPNPLFGMDPSRPDAAIGTTTPPDFAMVVIPDLAVKPPDLAPPVLCGPMGAPNGARACSNNLRQSGTCNGNKLASDRDCPMKSDCQ